MEKATAIWLLKAKLAPKWAPAPRVGASFDWFNFHSFGLRCGLTLYHFQVFSRYGHNREVSFSKLQLEKFRSGKIRKF